MGTTRKNVTSLDAAQIREQLRTLKPEEVAILIPAIRDLIGCGCEGGPVAGEYTAYVIRSALMVSIDEILDILDRFGIEWEGSRAGLEREDAKEILWTRYDTYEEKQIYAAQRAKARRPAGYHLK